MDGMKVDSQLLRDTASTLDYIRSEFTDANPDMITLQTAVGHDTLGQAVYDFAHSWDQTRKELDDDVTVLSKQLIEGAETVEKLDQGLADAVTGNGKPASSAPATGGQGGRRAVQ